MLLLAWQLAAMHSKGFPTPLSTLDSALTLFADPFYQDGPNDMGIGWNVLASCSAWRWASAWRRWRAFRWGF